MTRQRSKAGHGRNPGPQPWQGARLLITWKGGNSNQWEQRNRRKGEGKKKIISKIGDRKNKFANFGMNATFARICEFTGFPPPTGTSRLLRAPPVLLCREACVILIGGHRLQLHGDGVEVAGPAGGPSLAHCGPGGSKTKPIDFGFGRRQRLCFEKCSL